MERFWQWSREQQGLVVLPFVLGVEAGVEACDGGQDCMLLSVGHKQFAVEGRGDLVFVHLLSTMKVTNCTFILKLKKKHISLWFRC